MQNKLANNKRTINCRLTYCHNRYVDDVDRGDQMTQHLDVLIRFLRFLLIVLPNHGIDLRGCPSAVCTLPRGYHPVTLARSGPDQDSHLNATEEDYSCARPTKHLLDVHLRLPGSLCALVNDYEDKLWV